MDKTGVDEELLLKGKGGFKTSLCCFGVRTSLRSVTTRPDSPSPTGPLRCPITKNLNFYVKKGR